MLLLKSSCFSVLLRTHMNTIQFAFVVTTHCHHHRQCRCRRRRRRFVAVVWKCMRERARENRVHGKFSLSIIFAVDSIGSSWRIITYIFILSGNKAFSSQFSLQSVSSSSSSERKKEKKRKLKLIVAARLESRYQQSTQHIAL